VCLLLLACSGASQEVLSLEAEPEILALDAEPVDGVVDTTGSEVAHDAHDAHDALEASSPAQNVDNPNVGEAPIEHVRELPDPSAAQDEADHADGSTANGEATADQPIPNAVASSVPVVSESSMAELSSIAQSPVAEASASIAASAATASETIQAVEEATSEAMPLDVEHDAVAAEAGSSQLNSETIGSDASVPLEAASAAPGTLQAQPVGEIPTVPADGGSREQEMTQHPADVVDTQAVDQEVEPPLPVTDMSSANMPSVGGTQASVVDAKLDSSGAGDQQAEGSVVDVSTVQLHDADAPSVEATEASSTTTDVAQGGAVPEVVAADTARDADGGVDVSSPTVGTRAVDVVDPESNASLDSTSEEPMPLIGEPVLDAEPEPSSQQQPASELPAPAGADIAQDATGQEQDAPLPALSMETEPVVPLAAVDATSSKLQAASEGSTLGKQTGLTEPKGDADTTTTTTAVPEDNAEEELPPVIDAVPEQGVLDQGDSSAAPGLGGGSGQGGASTQLQEPEVVDAPVAAEPSDLEPSDTATEPLSSGNTDGEDVAADGATVATAEQPRASGSGIDGVVEEPDTTRDAATPVMPVTNGDASPDVVPQPRAVADVDGSGSSGVVEQLDTPEDVATPGAIVSSGEAIGATVSQTGAEAGANGVGVDGVVVDGVVEQVDPPEDVASPGASGTAEGAGLDAVADAGGSEIGGVVDQLHPQEDVASPVASVSNEEANSDPVQHVDSTGDSAQDTATSASAGETGIVDETSGGPGGADVVAPALSPDVPDNPEAEGTIGTISQGNDAVAPTEGVEGGLDERHSSSSGAATRDDAASSAQLPTADDAAAMEPDTVGDIGGTGDVLDQEGPGGAGSEQGYVESSREDAGSQATDQGPSDQPWHVDSPPQPERGPEESQSQLPDGIEGGTTGTPSGDDREPELTEQQDDVQAPVDLEPPRAPETVFHDSFPQDGDPGGDDAGSQAKHYEWNSEGGTEPDQPTRGSHSGDAEHEQPMKLFQPDSELRPESDILQGSNGNPSEEDLPSGIAGFQIFLGLGAVVLIGVTVYVLKNRSKSTDQYTPVDVDEKRSDTGDEDGWDDWGDADDSNGIKGPSNRTLADLETGNGARSSTPRSPAMPSQPPPPSTSTAIKAPQGAARKRQTPASTTGIQNGSDGYSSNGSTGSAGSARSASSGLSMGSMGTPRSRRSSGVAEAWDDDAQTSRSQQSRTTSQEDDFFAELGMSAKPTFQRPAGSAQPRVGAGPASSLLNQDMDLIDTSAWDDGDLDDL